MLVAIFIIVASLLSRDVVAQRPSNATLCDYYATTFFGANTTSTQFKLIQNILALAFAGGSGLSNASSELTGIFNPGTVVNPSGITIPIDLQPWFNASIDSTNLNGQPAAVNWLDAGGKNPLSAYLNGQTTSIVMPNSTNEYRLFNHWTTAFSRVFGCTLPTPMPPTAGGPLNLAYVHKFMDLNQTDLGHFINQLVLSSKHWGFSASDAAQLSIQLNARYNVRCSPAVGTQLFSLCQDETCPLAPQPDCNAYINLGPSGIPTSGPPGATSTGGFTPSLVPTSTAPPSSTITSPSSTSAVATPSATSAPSAAVLSPGGIAGVAIGGAAMLFAFIIILVWMLRRRRTIHVDSFQPSPMNPSYIQPAYTDPHTSFTGRSNQIVESWNGGPPIAEMESPRYGASPEMGGVLHSPGSRVDNRSPGPSPGPYSR